MSRRFSMQVAFRVTGLVLTIVSGTLLAVDGRFVITPFLFAVMSLAQAVGLVRFVERTNRELARFLSAVRAEDYTERFEREREGVGFDDLGRELTGLFGRIRALREQSEIDLRVLRAIIDHVPVPLIAVSPDDRVEHLNKAARRFFGTLHVVRVLDMKPLGDELVRAVETLTPGSTQLVPMTSSDRVLIGVSHVRSGAESRRVFSLQSLRGELETAEVEAWQALVRVLTHELMNSLTPVRSLAQSAAHVLQAGDAEAIEDAQVALRTVAKRADGLLRFIESYREVARVPKPECSDVRVQELLDRVCRLFKDAPATVEAKVTPETLVVRIDGEQIERVLINLVRNAIEAAPEARIQLSARLDERGRPVMTVSDDGPGIPAQVASKMFVPFYTTKLGGSGVGLSLTRQIMRAHGGFASFAPVEPNGAQFTLHF